jgi:hypothetical protein
VLGIGLVGVALAQTRRDPRGVALAGAYGTQARGIFAVDYNPANLAIEHEYASYRVWGGLNTSFSTNFLSVKTYRKYNGKDLEAADGALKKEFLRDIPPAGWRIFGDLHLALPYINFSNYNRAISSDLIFITDVGFPHDLVQFYFDGNPINKEMKLDFQEEIVCLMQWGYSIGFPVGGIFLGVTGKYLSGIGYLGVNPDYSYGQLTTYFEPGKNYIAGSGRYYFQQALGGRGFAIDVGLTTPMINHCRLGVSITNLFGHITWRRNTLISRLLDEEAILPWDGKHFVYNWQVNEARFDRLFGKTKFKDIFPGSGQTFKDTTGFVMSYPSLVRFSLAREVEPGFMLSTDLVAGFESRLFAFGVWKWAIGFESTKNKRFPLRIGVSFGGNEHQELAFGSGFHWGFVHLDWALGLKQGLFFNTAKGLEFALNCYTTSRVR